MKTTILFLLTFFLFLTAVPAFAIHDDAGDTKCLDCHFTLPFDRDKLSYTEEVGGVCRSCHTTFPCNDAGGAIPQTDSAEMRGTLEEVASAVRDALQNDNLAAVKEAAMSAQGALQ